MDVSMAKAFYDAAGVTPQNDPACRESEFAVERIRPFLEQFIYRGMKILDIGCGAGRFCFASEKLGAIPIGVDCAAIPLQHARMLAKKWGSSAEFVECDALNMPFADDTFDAVFLINNIVEYSYENIEQMAGKISKLLKPAGLFCVTMKDEIIRLARKGNILEQYDPLVYMRHDTYEVPGKGRFDYETGLWTVCFARYIIGKHFELVHSQEYGDGIIGMVFSKAGKTR